MKTSELTPLSAYKFAALVKEAGFPAVSTYEICREYAQKLCNNEVKSVGCRQYHHRLRSYHR
jgi:acyl-CoA reductase-like NAD-dependent aldehyde dehydrogenase